MGMELEGGGTGRWGGQWEQGWWGVDGGRRRRNWCGKALLRVPSRRIVLDSGEVDTASLKENLEKKKHELMLGGVL